MTYIDVRNLSKSFVVRKKQPHTLRRSREEVHALRDVSLRIKRGEMVGCMGPNGAGKSTLVKILSGILLPDGGTATVDGRVPWMERKAHVAHIGVVFGQRTQLWWDVSPLESYGLLRDIYRTPREAWRQRLDEMTEALGLAEFLRTPLRQLSLGQRMRAELAGSLLHSPELLFLDEPTIGLDALSKLKLRAFLKGRKPAAPHHGDSDDPRHGGYDRGVPQGNGAGARSDALRRRAGNAAAPLRYGEDGVLPL